MKSNKDGSWGWQSHRGKTLEVRKREWKEAPSGKAQGRPKKAPEDLSAQYRLKLEGGERVKARILAGMSKGQAQETERKENSKKNFKKRTTCTSGSTAGRDCGVRRDRPPGRRTRASSGAHCSRARGACLQRREESR